MLEEIAQVTILGACTLFFILFTLYNIWKINRKTILRTDKTENSIMLMISSVMMILTIIWLGSLTSGITALWIITAFVIWIGIYTIFIKKS